MKLSYVHLVELLVLISSISMQIEGIGRDKS